MINDCQSFDHQRRIPETSGALVLLALGHRTRGYIPGAITVSPFTTSHRRYDRDAGQDWHKCTDAFIQFDSLTMRVDGDS